MNLLVMSLLTLTIKVIIGKLLGWQRSRPFFSVFSRMSNLDFKK